MRVEGMRAVLTEASLGYFVLWPIMHPLKGRVLYLGCFDCLVPGGTALFRRANWTGLYGLAASDIGTEINF